VVLPRQGGHAQASQVINGRRGAQGISRGVSDHQREWPSGDPARVIDVANGQLESREQVPARLDPARPRERDERTDPHRVGQVACYSVAASSVTRIRHARR
jgi:hypothetical protein